MDLGQVLVEVARKRLSYRAWVWGVIGQLLPERLRSAEFWTDQTMHCQTEQELVAADLRTLSSQVWFFPAIKQLSREHWIMADPRALDTVEE